MSDWAEGTPLEVWRYRTAYLERLLAAWNAKNHPEWEGRACACMSPANRESPLCLCAEQSYQELMAYIEDKP